MIISSSDSNSINCGRDTNFSIGSSEWTINKSCSNNINKLEWKYWPRAQSLILHSGKVHPSEVSEVIIPGNPINILSNKLDEQLKQFTPASTATIAACFNAKWTGDYDIHCTVGSSMNEVKEENICIYAENLNLAGLFQHYHINTLPIRGLAIEIHDRFFPNSTLVSHYTASWHKGGLIKSFHTVKCEVILFVSPVYKNSFSLLSPPPKPTSWDCYWYGAFQHARNQTFLDSLQPNLLVFSDRDNRIPYPTDHYAFRLYLRDIAEEFGLTYYHLFDNATAAEKINIFSLAKVIISPHGGALANIIHTRTDSLIIEIHPEIGERRFCFLCMAYGIGMSHYGIYIESSWEGGYSAKKFHLEVSDAQKWTKQMISLTKFIKRSLISYYNERR